MSASTMTLQEAVRPLNACDTKEAVRDFLLEKKAFGVRRDGCGCPVANYLKDAIGKGVAVGVSTVTERVGRESSVAYLGLPVIEFIHAFDDGKFPALEAKD